MQNCFHVSEESEFNADLEYELILELPDCTLGIIFYLLYDLKYDDVPASRRTDDIFNII